VRDEFAKRGWEAVSADILPSETPVDRSMVSTLIHGQGSAGQGPEEFHSPVETGTGGWQRWDAGGSTAHYRGDVRDLFSWDHPVNRSRIQPGKPVNEQLPPWDLVIAFPPCTRLSYAGNRWRKEWQANGEEDAGAAFFMDMISAPSPLVAVENPRGVMFQRYRKPDQAIQPWWFGDPFRKTTCLWLKGLPPLVPELTEPEVLATVSSGDLAGYRLHRAATGGGSHRTDAGAEHPAHDFGGRKHYEDSEGRVNRAKVRSRTFPGVARAMAAQWGAFAEKYHS
jgi:hypothetical protein